MVRRKQTAADFPPEFMDIWNLAVRKDLMLSMNDSGVARNLIQRLYTFRKRLMEEAPEMAAPFMLVDLRVHDEAGNVIVGRTTKVPGKAIIRPYIPEWKAQVQKQVLGGVKDKVEEPSQRMIEELPELSKLAESGVNSLEEHSSDSLTETLSNIGYGTGNDS